jgi:hypothetical protein
MTKPKNPEDILESGRKTDYKEEYNEQVYKLCLLGAIDREIADFFGVCEATINNWKIAHPKFLESIRKGKTRADTEVVEKLYHRATGYSHEAVKIFSDKDGNTYEHKYIEHYPPDTKAATFILKNRHPDKWSDRNIVEHSGEMKTTPNVAINANYDQLKELFLDVENDTEESS